MFLDRMRRLLGDEYQAFAATYEQPARGGLRVNALKISSEEFLSLAPFAVEPLPWPPEGFLVAQGSQPGKHPFHAAGLYYLQDPSAMAPAVILDPQPGDRVLDLAAAPGGKSTHLASLLKGRGLLVANEVHGQRVHDLAENLERWGTRNVAITNETPERLAEAFPEYFDRVLLDAPCSGEGMLRRSAAARAEWGPELVSGCAMRQSGILTRAARTVRPGGYLAYVTCTFSVEENEGVVAGFLRERPDFTLVPIPAQPGFAPGRPDWLPAADRLPDLERAVRIWPHRFPGEGHFVALLRRAGEAGPEIRMVRGPAEPEPSRRGRRGNQGSLVPAPRGARDLYQAFCAQHLALDPAIQSLAMTRSYLYDMAPELLEGPEVRHVHPGWWLGTLKKDRFEPSHALALALHASEVRQYVDLPPDGREVLAYLRGESLSRPGADGWVLVTVAGYSLGWGKRVAGVVKSHYPRGLRRY